MVKILAHGLLIVRRLRGRLLTGKHPTRETSAPQTLILRSPELAKGSARAARVASVRERIGNHDGATLSIHIGDNVAGQRAQSGHAIADRTTRASKVDHQRGTGNSRHPT